MLGGLKVVTTEPAVGLATLSFDGFELARQEYYIVKALPVRQAAPGAQSFTIVQFVEFNAQGFVLHMSQPPAACRIGGSLAVRGDSPKVLFRGRFATPPGAARLRRACGARR